MGQPPIPIINRLLSLYRIARHKHTHTRFQLHMPAHSPGPKRAKARHPHDARANERGGVGVVASSSLIPDGYRCHRSIDRPTAAVAFWLGNDGMWGGWVLIGYGRRGLVCVGCGTRLLVGVPRAPLSLTSRRRCVLVGGLYLWPAPFIYLFSMASRRLARGNNQQQPWHIDRLCAARRSVSRFGSGHHTAWGPEEPGAKPLLPSTRRVPGWGWMAAAAAPDPCLGSVWSTGLDVGSKRRPFIPRPRPFRTMAS